MNSSYIVTIGLLSMFPPPQNLKKDTYNLDMFVLGEECFLL